MQKDAGMLKNVFVSSNHGTNLIVIDVQDFAALPWISSASDAHGGDGARRCNCVVEAVDSADVDVVRPRWQRTSSVAAAQDLVAKTAAPR